MLKPIHYLDRNRNATCDEPHANWMDENIYSVLINDTFVEQLRVERE